MDALALVQQALQELGDVPALELSSFIERKHGRRIDPKFVPIFKATIRDKQRHEAARLTVRATTEQVKLQTQASSSVSSGSQRAWEARQLALELMAAHGLQGWSFGFNRRKRAMGLCVYRTRTIELSIHFVERDNPADEIRDTILHEIAHALVGHGHGHDTVWKRKCVEIGARPQRCGQADMPEGRWRASCKGCGKYFHRHRKPKHRQGWFCRTCGPDRGGLTWQETEQPSFVRRAV